MKQVWKMLMVVQTGQCHSSLYFSSFMFQNAYDKKLKNYEYVILTYPFYHCMAAFSSAILGQSTW
jgi:hypothetical protein